MAFTKIAAAGIGSTGTVTLQNVAVSGIVTATSLLLNNQTLTGTELQPLQVNGGAYVSDNVGIGTTNPITQFHLVGNARIVGLSTFTNLLTTNNGITNSGGNVNFSQTGGAFTVTSQTTGAITLGGASQTATQTFGQSTVTNTVNYASGATSSGNRKTINLGTGGLSGSFTQINVGPTTGVGTVTINSELQVVGSGTTTLLVQGNARITGILTVGTSSLTLDGVNDIAIIGTGVTITGSTGIISATNYFASSARRVVAFAAGTTVTFHQASAPTGWTKQTTHNDKALRVVSGTGGGSGGSTAFSTVMASRTPGGSVTMTNASFTLTTSEIPSHGHSVFVNSFAGDRQIAAGPLGADGDKYSFTDSGNDASTSNTLRATGTGSGSSHTHNNTASFTGTAMDFAVQYIDIILCSID